MTDATPQPDRINLPDHAAPKHAGGRPVVWTPERITDAKATVLDRLADGQSMRSICTQDDMPSWSTLRRWLREDVEFATQYARAREAAADMSAARVIEIAEAVAAGKMDPQAGRTAIDGHKWAASKLNARVYGDRIDVNQHHTGNVQVGWVIDLSPAGPVIEGEGATVIEGRTPADE
ncbi:hypothetical protein [Azospirillum argentinense]